MKEVIAGWAAGYTMGIVATVALAYLSRPGGSLYRVRASTFPDLPVIGFAVPVFVGASLICSMIGLAIGSIYRVGDFAAGPDGAGSPSFRFTAAICLVAVMPVPALVVLIRTDWKAWVAMAACFAAVFGWGMPVLAGL